MRFISNMKARKIKIRKDTLQPPVSERGKISTLVGFAEEQQSHGKNKAVQKSNYILAAADQRLLESFWTRKNAERKECYRQSGISKASNGDQERLQEVFSLTRKLLVGNAGPLNERFIRNDTLLEKALGKIHKHLPLPVRLALWKKKYIQFILTNRERLIP